jgi:hypothetical protein
MSARWFAVRPAGVLVLVGSWYEPHPASVDGNADRVGTIALHGDPIGAGKRAEVAVERAVFLGTMITTCLIF